MSNHWLVNIYRRLIHCLHLAGYGCHQYSNYQHPNSNPVVVWTDMVQLSQIEPPGKFQSTLLGLKIIILTTWTLQINFNLGEFFLLHLQVQLLRLLFLKCPLGVWTLPQSSQVLVLSDLFILGLLPCLMIQIATEHRYTFLIIPYDTYPICDNRMTGWTLSSHHSQLGWSLKVINGRRGIKETKGRPLSGQPAN